MKRNAKKVAILSITLILVAAAAVGFYMYNRGPVNIRTSRSTEINAKQLYQEYQEDNINARSTYDEKILSVSGKVASISKNQQGEPVVKLETATDGGYVNCTFQEQVSMNEGEMVKIKGLCTGMGQSEPELGIPGDVYISRAIFIN